MVSPLPALGEGLRGRGDLSMAREYRCAGADEHDADVRGRVSRWRRRFALGQVFFCFVFFGRGGPGTERSAASCMLVLPGVSGS